MSGPFPSAWQAGLDGSREDRRQERLAKERQRAKCTCEFVKDDYGAPQIKICEACSLTSTHQNTPAE